MKIARVNVHTEETIYEEILEDSKYFLLGGRGLTSRIILDEVPPLSDPLGEENKLIIATGLLTGSPFPCSGRTSIGGKSPLTNGIKEANVGGRPSIMLASYGIRALILEGKSPELKVISINEEGIKFHLAENYEGIGNYMLHKDLTRKYGERVGIYSIGPAGEYLMKAASVATNDLEGYPSRHAARGGLGAVMGSKRIKAIIILPRKTSEVRISNIKKFREASKPFAKELAETKKNFSIYGTPNMVRGMSAYGGLPTKNFRRGSYDKAIDISGESLHELVTARGGRKRVPCSPTCVIKCSNIVNDENGNHLTSSLEYETIFANGSNLLINNLDDIARIDHLCDNIGIDTIEFGVTIGVAMDAGKIPWGNTKSVFEILAEIKKGTETGKLYGNGVCHLGEKINAERIPHVKGQGISGYDPRVFKAMSITYVTTPMGADHTAGAAIPGRVASQTKDYGELTENNGKLDLSYELQLYTSILDSLGCCYFIGPSYENMEIVKKALNAMYALELTREDVINIGKSILKSELDFNKKAGILQEMDKLPEFLRLQPSEPTGLKFTFSKEELNQFWDKLDL
ncbi:MAG: aldehyde ferredoxin oxidoreductase [Candidatus Lokiarchaeota archaeon]|nr:aldehyde ferredoxin oxidoreductase [Candidatus Lokiarchaeota archaeon]